MKNFFYCVSCALTLIGGIIGAGFITGSELISFFGTEKYLSPLIFSCLIIFFGLYVSLSLASDSKDIGMGIGKITSRPMIYRILILVSSFAVLSAMTASLDLLASFIGVEFPIVSVLSLVFAHLICTFKIDGVRKANIFLVPFSIVVITVLLLCYDGADFNGISVKADVKALAINAPLYAFMNVFNSLPAVFSLGKGMKKKEMIFISALTAAVCGVFAFMILSFIGSVRGSKNLSLPIIALGGSGVLAVFLYSSLFSAVLSSVILSYYPLYTAFDGKNKARFSPLILIFAFIFSRFGLDFIIKYAYAFVGGVGGAFVFASTGFLLRSKKYKKSNVENNINKGNETMGVNMKKKKRNKPIKLTDSQYNDYIMALKDERPPKLIRETELSDKTV